MMTHEDYQKAAEHWAKADAASTKMNPERLLVSIQTYIQDNNTCALATGYDGFIRCTPIEYSFHNGAFYLLSEGGLKFKALEQNKNVCLAIFDQYEGFGKLKGLQIMGTAEIIEPFSKEYVEHAAFKKIPLTALKKLPEPMNLIKIIPTEYDFLNSDFKQDGLSPRQSFIVK